MARPKKPRKCRFSFKKLQGKMFKPSGIPPDRLEFITIYRDELEVIRLCDKKNLTQEEAGRKMGVSRGTVQRLLKSARIKIAIALSECKGMVFKKEENIKSS
ncbi:MAG: DUF134 domain-containing protein [Thermodesulfovibrionales bacterium]|nr:DUF134 domain-containing protein [Thermodesulfovibrionales bacterium]